MKKRIKIIALCVLSGIVTTLTACGGTESHSAPSIVETGLVTAQTSETLGLYLRDTNHDGNFDIVVNKYDIDVSEQYSLIDGSIYEGDTLVINKENTKAYIAVQEIAFTVESKTVHPQTSFTLDLAFLPENATCTEYDLTIDNEEILQLDNGNITAISEGETIVTATAKAGGLTATCTIIVNTQAEETERKNEQVISNSNINIQNTTNQSNTTSNHTNHNHANSTTHTHTSSTTNGSSGNTSTGNNHTSNAGTGNNNNSNSGNGTIQQPSEPVTSSPQTPTTPQPQIHSPIYTQKWIVDQAAWTEYIPIYQTVEWAMCTTCGADITGNTFQHMKEHALKGENGNWKSMFKQVQVGTREVYHEEKGHWESVLVCGGCTGSH